MPLPARVAWPEPAAVIVPEKDDVWSDPAFKDFDVRCPSYWADQATPERRWRLDGWIPDRQATYITGPGSAGKSLLGQQLATCIGLGLPFLGIPTEAATALYLSCEDDFDELHRRQKAIGEALRVPLDRLRDRLHLVSATSAALFDKDDDGRLDATSKFRNLSAIVKLLSIKFLVLDNTAHLFAGNENDRHEVATFLGLLNKLARQMDGAVLLIGHPNKAGDSFSGSTAWENQVRSRLFMARPEDSPDPDARVLSREKSNYARQGETLAFRWHQWAFIRDEDLDEDQRAEIAAVVMAGADNDAFLACLDQRTREGRHVSERPGQNYAPAEFERMAEAKNIGKARLRDAMDRLFRLGAIERAVLRRDKDKGRDIEGLRRTPNATPGRFPDASHTSPKPTPDQTPNDPPHTPPYYVGAGGAADDGPPPASEPWPEPDTIDLDWDSTGDDE